MAGRYLTDLADVCRAAGLAVVENAGWQTRARSSGGYAAGLPNHVMCHHTASTTSTGNDVAYIVAGADAAPLANLYLGRDGAVTVCAAGATNTNGTGSAPWGGCPDDEMNTHAIGIEAANNGTGEPWPSAQQDAYQTLVGALCAAYAIPLEHVRGHAEWSPGRKIDPAGPSRWANGSATWNMNLFRDDLGDDEPPPPDPEPIPPVEETPMPFLIEHVATGQVVLIYADGLTVGLVGADVPFYVDRFGDALPVSDDAVWQAFLDKAPR